MVQREIDSAASGLRLIGAGRRQGSGRTPVPHLAGRGTGDLAATHTPYDTRLHKRNPAIVVFGRSYGRARMIEKRGPQLVQFVKG